MRVFLDASFLILAIERPESNCAKIFSLVLGGRLDAVVDEVVINEVSGYFRGQRGRSYAWLYAQQIRRVTAVLTLEDCKQEFKALAGRLKEGDRLHLAVTRASKADCLIALDEDFEPFPEYLTPREAAKRLGLRPSPTEW